MGSSKAHIGLLSCFGCGPAALSRNASCDADAQARRSNGPNNSNLSSATCRAGSGGAEGGPIGSLSSGSSSSSPRPSDAARLRRPSTAFTEESLPAPGLALSARSPVKKARNASAAARDDSTALPTPPAAGTGDQGRLPSKPRGVRTSPVSPAYDTKDEVSPAGSSRSAASSEAYSYTFPEEDEEDERTGEELLPAAGGEGRAGCTGGGCTGGGCTGGGGEGGGPVGLQAGDLGKRDPPFPGAVEDEEETKEGGEGASPAFQRAASPAGTRRNSTDGTANKGSNDSSNSRSSTNARWGSDAGSSSSSGGGGGTKSTGPGGAVAAAAAHLPAGSTSPPRLGFSRRGGASSSGDATAATAVVTLDDAAADGAYRFPVGGVDVPYTAATERRGSFAGDSSASLMGPGNVSVTPPPLRTSPSLREGPEPPSPSEQQQQQQPLCAPVPCKSLHLTPPPPPSTLQTCGSLRLTPTLPQRCMTPSLSQRSAPLPPPLGPPLAEPSPPSSPPPKPSSPRQDHRLRLPPPQATRILQRSPCAIGHYAFPRANTLAPLVHGHLPPPPLENAAPLSKLVTDEVPFRERLQQQQQQRQMEGSNSDRGATAAEMATRDAALDGESSSAAVAAASTSDPKRPVSPGIREQRLQQRTSSLPKATSSSSGRQGPVAMAATARSGGGGDDNGEDLYDNDDYSCNGEDADSMVGRLLPPLTSTLRSSAPAVPFGFGAPEEDLRDVRLTGSLERPPSTSTAAVAGTPPLSDMGAQLQSAALAVSELLKEEESSLGARGAQWLEELLPPSPGFGWKGPTGRSGPGASAAAAAGARPRPQAAAVTANDSFRCLMMELD